MYSHPLSNFILCLNSMLDHNDIAQLRGMFEGLLLENTREWTKALDQRDDRWNAELDLRDDKWTKTLDQRDSEWKEGLDQYGRDLKHEIRDEIHAIVNGAVFASEQRLIQRMDDVENNLRQEIHDVKDAVIDIIDESVLPQIEEHRIEIVKVKRQLQLA